MSRLPKTLQRALALSIALLALAGSGLVAVPAASAGEYRVFACQLANGAPITLGDWTLDSNVIGPGADECASQGLAYFQLGPPQTGTTSYSGVGIAIPDGLLATSIRGNRWVKTLGGSDNGATPAYQLRYSTSGAQWYGAGTTFRDQCRELDHNCTVIGWDAAPGTEFATDLPGGAKWIGLTVACLAAPDPAGACGAGGGGRAHLRVNRLDLTISDTTNPVVGSPSGSLLQGGARSGSQSLTFAATDVGAGIYQAIVQIDGTEIGRTRPDGSLTCRDAGALPEMELEFTRVQPCSRSLGVAFDVDTTRITNGTHRVSALVRDAAGNLSNVISQDITVANAAPPAATPTPGPGPTPAPTLTPAPTPKPTPGPTPAPGETPIPGSPNGLGGDLGSATVGHKGERRSVSTRFGKRPTITGKVLDAAGKPITRAQLDVFERVDLPSGSWVKVGTAETDVAGKYVFKPLAGASKRVRFSYATTVGGSDYRSTREVRVNVAAALSIAATPKIVPRRGLVKLSGRVRIDQLPTKGVYVDLQVRRVGGWATVASRALTPSGTWSYQHRFQRAANATLAFRARLRPANDVASSPAASAAVRVRIR